ncbi:unnamed protein product [Euphydryas editha]|uniref:DUF7041 domain-containing protein n=1 Tax=Euphydryas editha TaxID=104508 RepID=A0AAU9TRR8_EUPED|nr:unnamed protein product [Euphydryas editha]
MPKDGEQNEGKELYRVGIRVPPFYPQKPPLWFAQLESQFVLSNISADETKFHYAFGQLDPAYAAEVEDVITSSTFAAAKDKYVQLKTHLINRLSESRQKK